MSPNSDPRALPRDRTSRAYGLGARPGRADDPKNTTPISI
jgi:hypothetical protein